MTHHARRLDLSPVILAGGSGTRLWPMSRRTYPKHLIALTSEQSLLQQCAVRVTAIAEPARTITVGAVDQGDLLAHQLTAVDPVLVDGLVLEPAARNTAAACAAAALFAETRFGPEQLLWVCAADHLMDDMDALFTAVAQAAEAAAAGRLVTFGITPAHAEPGFGYIKVGPALAAGSEAFDVAQFVEKPDRAVAQAMLDAGGHLWNSGMFVFRVDTFVAELERHAPDILDAARRAMAAGDGRPLVPDAAYARIPSAPVDKAVMEVSDRVAVVPCDPRWSDVGSWRAVWETLPQDDAGNASRGDVVLEGARDCLVIGGDRLIAAVGVHDLAIIDTGDALMVADRDDSAAVKAVVGKLTDAGRAEAQGYPSELLSWGERRRRHVAGAVVVSDLIVQPGNTARLEAPAGHHVHVFGGRLQMPLVIAPGAVATLTNDGAKTEYYVEVSTAVGTERVS